MESARKIELQAPEDLAYLIANVRRAAAARIDEAFPPVDDDEGSEDELRTRIEQLVDEYITKTFAQAAPNLTINGLPVDASHFLPSSSSTRKNPLSASQAQAKIQQEIVYEPFDARKRVRVEALTAEEEDLLRDIARLKKGVPAAAAAAWADAARAGVRDDEEALEMVNSRFGKKSGGGGDDNNDDAAGILNGDINGSGSGSGSALTIAPLDRQDAMETSFANAVRGLGRLKREMPAVVARMERARKAGEYVVTER
ncbi:hypothetical protein F5Y14DRAFT_436441 [Nemania sp. NC0429]|nr:hypothetical protein F5Y14DRAFT_436441 [Nemania sp. NC0429]